MLAALPRSSFQNWCRKNGLPYRSRLFWSPMSSPAAYAKHRLHEADWTPLGHLAEAQSRRERLDRKSTPQRSRRQCSRFGCALRQNHTGSATSASKTDDCVTLPTRNCFSCARCQVLPGFLRRTSIPMSASPRRATAEPPSGTARVSAANPNLVSFPVTVS
jgi:hypothetical protein